ncbi:hypothetical protein T4E_2247 [Trichinella pseudospiralis]|uniref:SCAN domain-containing protein 3 n=1 Tax=Trichinella pseudospiralis TaxID=6337 RepID=A0A0V0XK72_TRIPS|nr:hypothetical protein T4E_2247 [Trichinella pseudospiralis]
MHWDGGVISNRNHKDDLIIYVRDLSWRFKEYFPELEKSTFQWIVNLFLSDLTETPDSVNGYAEKMIGC